MNNESPDSATHLAFEKVHVFELSRLTVEAKAEGVLDDCGKYQPRTEGVFDILGVFACKIQDLGSVSRTIGVRIEKDVPLLGWCECLALRNQT